MSKFYHALPAIAALALLSMVNSATRAQGIDAAAYYSQGVNAYFAGQSSRAEAYLNTLLSVDPDDPRAYYFRALALLRQGRRDEARSDMQTGAALEAQHPNRFAIGAALERVQGSERLLLEQYRHSGQLGESQLRVEREQVRYEQARAREPEVTYQKATIPLASLLQSGVTRPAVVFEPIPRPRLQAVLPTSSALPVAPVAAAADPFTDDAAGAAAATNPRALQPATPTNTIGPTQPSTPLNVEADDPFTTPPAGGSAPRTPPARSAAPPTTTPPAEEDPFATPRSGGAARQTPPAAQPTSPTPPAAQPATPPPADEDPFKTR